MSRGMWSGRSFLASCVMVLAVAGVTGCVPGNVCTTIGYFSTAEITLAEPRPGLTLQLCDGADCEPVPVTGPVGAAPEGSPSPPAEDTGVLDITGNSSSGWTAQFTGGQPTIGYRLTDAASQVVGQGDVDVEWVQVGGSAQCGGPREATVELPD